MAKGKEAYQNELIERYRSWEKKHNEHDHREPIACIARDEMRKIRNIFEKNFHESIDLYVITWYNKDTKRKKDNRNDY